MFTPPPSPRPFRPKDDDLRQDASDLFVQADALKSPSPCSSHDQKRLIGQKTRWAALLVPLVVILITASTRYLIHPAAFDAFSRPPEWDTFLSNGMDWTVHRRHPSSDPQVTPSSTTTTSLPATSPSAAPASQPIPTIPSSPPALPTPFPQPFDSDVSQNFSSVSCSNFFANMTNTPAFRSCRPFSLLMDSSASFIAVSEA